MLRSDGKQIPGVESESHGTSSPAKLTTPPVTEGHDAALLRDLLVGASKTCARLPTQRRDAIQFRYEGVSAEYSMEKVGSLVNARPAGEVVMSSSCYRDLHRERSDSWEVELCVGIATSLIIIPRWEAVKQLGRALVVFKVHKSPAICEMFFMRQSEVVATYKDRMRRTLEWTNLYDPNGEIAFWAELYKPANKSGARSRSFLTDELCGAFGARLTIPALLPDKLDKIVEQIAKPPEQVRELTLQVQAQIEKKQKKRARQKVKKSEARAAKEAEGEVDDKGACIVCFEGPSSWMFEVCKHLCVCRNCAMNLLDQNSEATSKKSIKVCPLCRTESRLVHIDNYRGNADDVFGDDMFFA